MNPDFWIVTWRSRYSMQKHGLATRRVWGNSAFTFIGSKAFKPILRFNHLHRSMFPSDSFAASYCTSGMMRYCPLRRCIWWWGHTTQSKINAFPNFIFVPNRTASTVCILSYLSYQPASESKTYLTNEPAFGKNRSNNNEAVRTKLLNQPFSRIKNGTIGSVKCW